MQTAIQWLQSSTGHYVLTLLGGFLLKRWPAFPTRVVPVMLWAGNVLVVLATGLGGEQHGVLASIAAGTVTTVAAVGTHSALKNVWQFITGLVGVKR